MRKNIVILVCITAVFLSGYFLQQYFRQPKEIHIHAGFQVYVDGNLQDFSGFEYMSIKPCTNDTGEPPGKKTKEEIQKESAHLHDGVGDVMHSHFEGATWGDLYTNINFTIDRSKPIQGYIDGKEVKNIFKEKVMPYQSVTILIGTYENPETYLEKRVSQERILEIEKKSEDCGATESQEHTQGSKQNVGSIVDLTNQTEVVMNIQNFKYEKPNIRIKKGTKVTWTNQDTIKHNVMKEHEDSEKPHDPPTAAELDPNKFAGPLLAKGERYSFVFNEVSEYSYHCSLHPYMKGLVDVVN